MKKILLIILLLLFLNIKSFSQELNIFEVEVRYFNLIIMTFRHMEARRMDLSEYRMFVNIENNILHVSFYKPHPTPELINGSPPGYLAVIYDVDIINERIIRMRYLR